MINIVTSYIQRIIGVTSFKREKIWTGKVEDVGLIETYRVGSVADKSHIYICLLLTMTLNE